MTEDQLNPIETAGRILNDLKSGAPVREELPVQGTLDPNLALLRAWQAERLTITYADLLADKQYAPLCNFFLSDIYAPRDFSQRNQDAENLYAWLSRLFPPSMLELLSDTLTLNHLTDRLDRDLVNVLVESLGMTDIISAEMYAAGYRICDNYMERVKQIQMLVKILAEVSEGAHLPIVGLTLRLARIPAKRAGWSALYDFLARGYAACRSMQEPQFFLQTIKARETRILDRIYASDPNPFELD